ncbi:3017_t:CDS:1, partial [Gigaspora rosea]
PEDEHFDANDSVLETVAIIQNNGDEPIYIPNIWLALFCNNLAIQLLLSS